VARDHFKLAFSALVFSCRFNRGLPVEIEEAESMTILP
jgi:hypothetical protein